MVSFEKVSWQIAHSDSKEGLLIGEKVIIDLSLVEFLFGRSDWADVGEKVNFIGLAAVVVPKGLVWL